MITDKDAKEWQKMVEKLEKQSKKDKEKQDNNASFEGISEEEFNKKHMKALAQADPHNFKKKKKRRIKKESA
jgi:hypothetical protein